MEVYKEMGATSSAQLLQKNIGRVERLLETRGGAPAPADEPAATDPASDDAATEDKEAKKDAE